MEFLKNYFEYGSGFFSNLVNPTHRLFFVFLCASALIAYVLYKKRAQNDSFWSFLFPKSVWSNPSAWLDVRYFFFHGLIGHFILHGLAAAIFISSMYMGAGSIELFTSQTPSPHSPAMSFLIGAVCVIVFTIIGDFVAYCLHYFQHKIPLLWQFHKVHHSGEVMHPLSNFREHPIDNLVYKFVISLITGLSWGFMIRLMGYIPSFTTLFGLGTIYIFFNLGAYQLRHSHIWLRWPGNWSKIFPSPAHHQVHHSRHPDHLDKNFAFLLPIWDVIFGTYVLPETNEHVEFGIVEDSSELNSCLNLYFIPFRDAYRVITASSKKTMLNKNEVKNTGSRHTVPQTPDLSTSSTL